MNGSYILCGGLAPCVQRILEVDVLTPGTVHRVQKITESVGGKQINVARMTQALGGCVRAIGFSGGESGRKMLRLLAAENLGMEPVPVSGNTRTCQTVIDRATRDVTELVEELSPVSSAEQQAFISCFMRLRKDAAVIALSGTLPLGIPLRFYRTLTKDADVPLIVDTHGPALKEVLKSAPLLVKLNELELVATDVCGSVEESARRLLAEGAEWVLVTRGATGALLVHESGCWDFGVPDVDAINPIGSGDAVTAGIVLAVSQGRPLPAAVRFGLACGAAQTESLVSGVLDPIRARALENRVPFERVG